MLRFTSLAIKYILAKHPTLPTLSIVLYKTMGFSSGKVSLKYVHFPSRQIHNSLFYSKATTWIVEYWTEFR